MQFETLKPSSQPQCSHPAALAAELPTPTTPRAPRTSHPRHKTPEQEKKERLSKHARNCKLASRVRSLGRETLAERLEYCTVRQGLWFCPRCGHSDYRNEHCKQRLCTFCAPKIAARHSKKLAALVGQSRDPKFITLTMPRSPNLAEGIDKIITAFTKWRRLKKIQGRLRGGAWKLEAKPKPDGWHVHIHLLCDALYIPLPLLKSTWGKCIKHAAPSVDARRLMGAAMIRDHAKYAAKADDVDQWTDAQLDEFLSAMHNRRTIQTFGSWHHLDPQEELSDALPEENFCPHCPGHVQMYPIRAGPSLYAEDWEFFREEYIGDIPDRRLDPALENEISIDPPPAANVLEEMDF